MKIQEASMEQREAGRRSAGGHRRAVKRRTTLIRVLSSPPFASVNRQKPSTQTRVLCTCAA